MFHLLLYFNLLVFSFSTNEDNNDNNHKILVAYFSCTGNTKRVANNINSLLGGDIQEIVPAIPYTSEDINYRNNSCRANIETNDPSILPEISGDIKNFNEYTTIFIGYPIWGGKAPNIIRTFMKKYDFTNKNIITFSTSASSSDSSKSFLQDLAPNAKWDDQFKRFSSSVSKSVVKTWLVELKVQTSILVVYFSATGNTKNVANYIKNANLADIKEIQPVVPYTKEDIDYTNDESRVSQERKDPNLRPEINDIRSIDSYNIILVGYPLWWGKAPHVLYTFIESKDFANKKIIPFCTSASSSFGSSGTDLQSKATKDSIWIEGRRFASNQDETTVTNWIESIEFNKDDNNNDNNNGDNNDNNNGDNNDNNNGDNNYNNNDDNKDDNNNDHGNSNDHKIIVAYFSATGNTKRVAQNIHKNLKYGKLVEITPVNPYSSSDLNYGNSESRVSKEHQDPSLRPEINDISGIDQAETIFVGYPLWWQEAPHVVYTFIEKYNIKDKTIIPFCTSSSSSLGKSDKNLADKAKGAKWMSGRRFQSRVDEQEVKKWFDEIVETNSENEIKFKNDNNESGKGLPKGAIAGIVVAAVVVVAVIIALIIVFVKKRKINEISTDEN